MNSPPTPGTLFAATEQNQNHNHNHNTHTHTPNPNTCPTSNPSNTARLSPPSASSTMGKKKPFLDKKTASVFHVVHRSQRDVGTEATADTLSEFVLMPSPDNAQRERARERQPRKHAAAGGDKDQADGGAWASLQSRVAAAGLRDETAATYSRHTKPIAADGTFVPAGDAGHLDAADADHLRDRLTDASRNGLDGALAEAMAAKEVGRMLDSIALTAECMDEDVAAALFGDFEEGDFEEILDDFCVAASAEPAAGEAGGADGDGDGDGDGAFDYERHVQALMAKARAKEGGAGGEAGRELAGEDDFFGGATPLHGKVDEDDAEDDFDYDQYGEEVEEDSLDREFNGEAEDGSADLVNPGSAMDDEQQRILCEKFEEALAGYDSDDVGDLDNECEEIGGERALEGDAQVEAALDEFLAGDRGDDVLMEGGGRQTKRAGGSGYSALVGGTLVRGDDLLVRDGRADDPAADPAAALRANVEESQRQMQRELAEADAVLARPEADLPPEEVLIDGRSYFSVTPSNPWDCESILSTYSNLDNNPAVIGRSRKKKKGRKKKPASVAPDVDGAIPEDAPVRIRLSAKTGLPLPRRDPEEVDETPDDYDEYGEDGDTYLSVNLGEARPAQETAADKKARKQAVRGERKIRRLQKKMMKEAFQDEFQRRGALEAADVAGGSAVFRF